MDKMRVASGRVLKGAVSASGSKNAALPILFSALLAEGKHVFHNVPHLKDIENTCELLQFLGCKTHHENSVLTIDVGEPPTLEAPYDIVRKMRASILVLGPLITRYGRARVSMPGGCAIGTRPIDLHIEGLRALGAEIELDQGYVNARSSRLKGNTLLFESPTVGGTENLMMAACLASGTTIIENAAKEPEIVDLANYLNKMGATVQGAGTSILRIEGVQKLSPAEHSIMPDRIEVGTLLIAAAITGGEVTVQKARPQDLEALLAKLKESGFSISSKANEISLKSPNRWFGVDLTTTPHPGFPTDLQAQFMALMTQAEGTSVITETVFENRFMHVQELMRLGADITPKTRVAVVRGAHDQLVGAEVMATDLRASACLVLAGLVAKGETTVSRIYHLDRGYEGLEHKLTAIGADISRLHE